MLNKPSGFDEIAQAVQNLEWQFRDALFAQGYGDHLIPADSEWHDFAFPGSKREKKNGAAKLTFDGDGVVIDRRKGKSPIFVWKPGAQPELTPEQLAALRQQNAQREAELKRQQEEARSRVRAFRRGAESVLRDQTYRQLRYPRRSQ
jgi:hypothetical protein